MFSLSQVKKYEETFLLGPEFRLCGANRRTPTRRTGDRHRIPFQKSKRLLVKSLDLGFSAKFIISLCRIKKSNDQSKVANLKIKNLPWTRIRILLQTGVFVFISATFTLIVMFLDLVKLN
jgi:hypothetical protein